MTTKAASKPINVWSRKSVTKCTFPSSPAGRHVRFLSSCFWQTGTALAWTVTTASTPATAAMTASFDGAADAMVDRLFPMGFDAWKADLLAHREARAAEAGNLKTDLGNG